MKIYHCTTEGDITTGDGEPDANSGWARTRHGAVELAMDTCRDRLISARREINAMISALSNLEDLHRKILDRPLAKVEL